MTAKTALKLTASALALAAFGFVGSAMATPIGQIDNQTYGLPVNITVEPEVSVWAGGGEHTNPPPVVLDMNGADGNNSATALSSITWITNVDGNVQVQVDGTLPAPIVSGGGINFFIFHNGETPADAVNAISGPGGSAYNPAGALVWNYGTLGTSQELTPHTGVWTSMHTSPIVYASASPGELPLPNAYNLVVTYTIAANL